MCGIAGIVRPAGAAPSIQTLRAMGEAQRHRGPDDSAVRVWGRTGFSFRRLSIIDVAGGAQPISNEDGSIHIILNGEIYNHRELREQLEKLGHRYRSHSDVESVLHGYEEWGDAVVARLLGMFAFAVWDEPRQRMLLARDRLGKKPLVYFERDGHFSFASELQSLLQDPAVPKLVDLEAIHHYLTYQYVPAPLTGFAGVRKLPPAHTLVVERGTLRLERYWTLRPEPLLAIPEQDAAAEVSRLLRDAVRARLMSEVPLGAFLSGGIDSSSVVALMAESGRVKTYSVGFEEQDFDELRFARLVAERYATEHHEFVVRPRATEVLETLVRHYGEPYADSSAVPTYYVSQLAGAHVRVALCGDGGDELFAGYDRYRALSLYAGLARLPGSSRLSRLAARALGRALPGRAVRLLHAVSRSPEESYARTVSCLGPEEKDALYTDEMRARVGQLDSYEQQYRLHRDWSGRDLLSRTLYVDTLTYLPGDLLAKVDIAAMAVGLEARSPFLDHRLVEFAARLPPGLKLRGARGKHILRRAMGDLLPDAILRRSKKGFGVPIDRWFRGELRELTQDVLLSPRAAQRPFFQSEAVARIWGEHQSGARDRGAVLWALLCLELWCRHFLDG